MIVIRLSSIEGKEPQNIEIISEETLSDAIVRAVGNICNQDTIPDVFQALVNGHLISPDLWVFVKLQKEDSVLIAPRIKSGPNGSLLKTVAIIFVTAITGGAGAAAGFWAAGSITAGIATGLASIGTAMLLNSMFPPPIPGDFGYGSGGSSVNGSQMYSVSGQSNSVRKFGFVPKVYGNHRFFPLVAANPYTELEIDPVTGETIQYFYAIYDFGLGPALVQDLKIGDTPLSEFTDVTYNLVDLNKPVISEGVWDDALKSIFNLYKGDVASDNVTYVLNGNKNSGDVVTSYETTRNSAVNPNLVPQEITLNFVCPQGLYAYSATGDRGIRNIYLEISFSKVSESVWKGFNDTEFVSSFKSVGGSQEFQSIPISIWPQNIAESIYSQTEPNLPPDYSNLDKVYTRGYRGILKGATYIIATSGIPNGATIFIGDRLIGKIVSNSLHSGSYYKYYFEYPVEANISLFEYKVEAVWSGASWSPPISYTYTFLRNLVSFNYSIPYVGRAKISSDNNQAVYSMFKFTPKIPGEYKVKVTRVSTSSTYSSQMSDNLTWGNIITRTQTSPIITDKRHVFIELKIRATNQLSGSIQNLSGRVQSALEIWDGANWSRGLTSNPAWIYTDLLIGQVNKRAITKDRLAISSIKEWADFCSQIPTSPPSSVGYFNQRFLCNFVLDFDTTLQSVVNQVTSAGQASLNIIDGKYGVLIDKLKTIPIQVFTPRNSWGFSSARNYTKMPHALKVSYINPDSNWEVSEKIVYDDGYTAITATEFDSITSFGVTNHEQAWRFGRYLLAQNRLRQETISLTVDFEHLVCTRGDYVQITQDVMKTGGFPARVKSVSGSQIIIDDGIDTLPISYGFIYRAITGEIYTNTLTVNSSDTFTLNGGNIPQVGDMIIIGEVGSIALDCLVKSITPNDDLTAQLILMEKADAIYSSESTSTIPNYSPNISKVRDSQYLPPGEVVGLVVVDNAWQCLGAGYEYYIDLDWDVPTGAAFDLFEIYVDEGKGYDLRDSTKTSSYRYLANEADLGVTHNFKILAVSSNGLKLNLSEVGVVTATPQRKSTPPSNVVAMSIDITGEVLQLSWERIIDCDCSEYLIRYSPLSSSTWEASIPVVRVDKNTSTAAIQARTGSYYIKAIDFNGNESAIAMGVITTIPSLTGLNIIATTNDFPTLAGDFDRTVKSGTSLILENSVVGGVTTSEYYSEGFYYYQDLLDLGEIYTVRLQALVQAEGYTLEDLISNWVTLDTVVKMSNSLYSEWDVETQYRTTDVLNVMSAWTTMSSVSSMSGGAEDIWTPWKTFIMGDATGRIFQFRLRLISNKVSVSPRVFNGEIKADMPDRIESYNNLTTTGGIYELAYTPAFMGPGTTPNIQVSIENAASGDYWSFDYKTLTGFKIRIFDKNNNLSNRTFDISVKGYGRKATAII